jgi:hypothetical protein
MAGKTVGEIVEGYFKKDIENGNVFKDANIYKELLELRLIEDDGYGDCTIKEFHDVFEKCWNVHKDEIIK